ncbi:MAG: sugar transferase [Desulfobacteraceae bacterium]|nr:sugar transferase [Desulfobacteraceae bacterium]MBC2753931.1 sugar transferase [Desulfobacteraceae bacterium]
MKTKRIFDYFASLAGVIVLSPLLLMIAVFIKLDSVGSVFYRSKRIGKGGRIIRVLKFRTMVEEAEHLGPPVTYAGDHRITRFGKILRKTKLDEIPQLFNVINGDMSLVGPRAEDPKFARYFEGKYQPLLSVQPGMTGMSWVKLKHFHEERIDAGSNWEKHYVEVSLPRKLEMDLLYVNNKSLLLDVCLIIQTVAGLLKNFIHPSKG